MSARGSGEAGDEPTPAVAAPRPATPASSDQAAIGPLTALFVPATRPDRYAKALASAADAVILDLEDAVPADLKDPARATAAELLATRPDKPVQVRVNGLTTPWWERDLAALAHCPGLAAVRLPKVESVRQVRAALALIGPRIPVHCTIESALGVEAAFEIAGADPRVRSIGLGEADLAGDLGVTDPSGLAWARSRIVVAARAAGLPSPAMSVYADLGDDQGLYESCVAGRRAGFLGRAVIHPKQIPTVVRAFAPTPAEIRAAEATLDALAGARILDGGTAVLADGRFVDRAMREAAVRVLALRDLTGARAAAVLES